MANTPIQLTEQVLLEAARKYAPVLSKLPMIVLQDTISKVHPIQGIQGDYVMANLKSKATWATYRKNDGSGNEIKIAPRTLTTRLLSMQGAFDPQTVAGKLYNQRPNVGDTIKDLPIAAQVIAQAIVEASDDLNNNIFNAEYNTASAGGTTPAQSFDGWDSICAKEIVKGAASESTDPNAFDQGIATKFGNYVDWSTHTLDEDNTFDALNYLWSKTDEKLKRAAGTIFFYVSPQVLDYYNIGYLKNVGPTVYNRDYQHPTILSSDGKAKIMPLASKAGSQFIQVTTQDNMLFGCSSLSDIDNLVVKVPELWDVIFGGTTWLGTQFEYIHRSKLLVAKVGGMSEPKDPFATA